MSSEPSLLSMETTAIQETVGQMCAGHERLGTFLRGLFDDLDALVGDMVRHGRKVDSAKQDQDAFCNEREERLGQERQAIDSTIDRLQQLTDQLGTSAAASSGDPEQFQAIFAGIEEERSALRTALQASESHGNELARMADELAAARQDLAEARDEIRSQRELLSKVPDHGEQSAAVSEANNAQLARMADELAAARQDLAEAREEIRAQRDLLAQAPAPSEGALSSEIQSRLEQMEQERLAWTQERVLLETELDTVRGRAAELADSLDEERQRATGERKDWSDELRQMRQLLQTLSDQKATAGPEFTAPPPAAAEQSDQGDPQDPVLDSVMAQFEILQKDLARRRKAKPASK